MTETRATPVEFPPGRYGRRRDPRRRPRWVPVVAGLVIITAGLAVTLKLYRQYGVPPYEVGAVTVTEVTSTSAKISFEVRVPAGESAACTIRARNHAGAEVGRTAVTATPGTSDNRTAHGATTITTTEQSFYTEVTGCGPAR